MTLISILRLGQDSCHIEDDALLVILVWNLSQFVSIFLRFLTGVQQSGRSPKVVAIFSATNFSSYIIELLQLHDTIQIEWQYT